MVIIPNVNTFEIAKLICKERKTAHLKNSYLPKDVINYLNQLKVLKSFKSHGKLQLKTISFKRQLSSFMKVVISPSVDNYPYIGIIQNSTNFRLWYLQVKWCCLIIFTTTVPLTLKLSKEQIYFLLTAVSFWVRYHILVLLLKFIKVITSENISIFIILCALDSFKKN